MAKKQITHRSMRGKVIDMELLRKKNELVPAIGNARVNARGDELGPGGKIIRKREDIVKEHYAKFAKDEQGRLKKPSKQETTDELTEAEIEMLEEEWLEDEDGNFIQKGGK